MKITRPLTLLALGLLSTLSAQAGEALIRITCFEEATGSEIYINGKFKGECPLDVGVQEGQQKVRVVKKVDANFERVFEQEVRMGDGAVKKMEVKLGESQLTTAGKKRVQAGDAAVIKAVKKQSAAEEAATADAAAAAAEAQRRESATWNAAERSNTENGYRAYLRGYPAGMYAALATARIQKLQADPVAKEEQELWMRAETTSDIVLVENYLRRYPAGRYVASANALLTAMKEREPAKVKVTIYRESQFVGGGMTSKISVDDRWVGSLKNGESLSIDVHSGTRTLSVLNTSSWGGHECQIRVTLEAGTTYRYFLDFTSGGTPSCSLTQKNDQVMPPS